MIIVELRKEKMGPAGRAYGVYHEGEHILSSHYPLNRIARFFLDCGHPGTTLLEWYWEGQEGAAGGTAIGILGAKQLRERSRGGFEWSKWSELSLKAI